MSFYSSPPSAHHCTKRTFHILKNPGVDSVYYLTIHTLVVLEHALASFIHTLRYFWRSPSFFKNVRQRARLNTSRKACFLRKGSLQSEHKSILQMFVSNWSRDCSALHSTHSALLPQSSYLIPDSCVFFSGDCHRYHLLCNFEAIRDQRTGS